jgi:hypothetical protein
MPFYLLQMNIQLDDTPYSIAVSKSMGLNILNSSVKAQLAEYISQILLKYYIPTIEMLVK